jgi:hypothetical protein
MTALWQQPHKPVNLIMFTIYTTNRNLQHLLTVQTKHIRTKPTGPRPIGTDKTYRELSLSGQNLSGYKAYRQEKIYQGTKPIGAKPLDGKNLSVKLGRIGFWLG